MPTKLVPAICTQCGGSVAVDPSQEKAFCSYCGTSFFVEKAINNYNVQQANIERVESMNIHHHSRGAVESVVNFIEKQQDKKQKKKDEEKRRLEEEERKRDEEFRKILPFLLIFIAVAIGVLYFMGATSEERHEGEARAPEESSYHEGRDYEDVVSDFEDNGFTNIETEKLEDLITGWLTKDGEVESVSVDGDVDYTANGWYPNDVEVIITYHTFPDKD